MKIKPIAFYLPQYHYTKENDEWWGKNYTEWTAVKRATSLFNGHVIKHPNIDIGYYNLEDVNIRKKQAEIAKEYGVYGFCYHHYWFNGRKFLEKPTELLLQDGEPNLPFCFNWANESLTRRWDGLDYSALLTQSYGTEPDWRKHIQYLIQFFKHKNYIKVDKKPIFLIYRIGVVSYFKQMLNVWNDELQQNGFDGINIIQVLGSFQDSLRNNYNDIIYGKCEFHPNIIFALHRNISKIGTITITDIKKNIDNILNIKESHKNYFYGAFPAWDNSPRVDRRATIYTNTTPDIFKKYLIAQAEKIIKRNSDTPNFLFLNAWNEWGEGCMLEPNTIDQYQYLEILREIVDTYK